MSLLMIRFSLQITLPKDHWENTFDTLWSILQELLKIQEVEK